MTTRIDETQARNAIRDALLTIVPDAELESIGSNDDLREAFELDSLDFLSFVEQLSSNSGVRIDEDDYDDLRTLGAGIRFLTRR